MTPLIIQKDLERPGKLDEKSKELTDKSNKYYNSYKLFSNSYYECVNEAETGSSFTDKFAKLDECKRIRNENGILGEKLKKEWEQCMLEMDELEKECKQCTLEG